MDHFVGNGSLLSPSKSSLLFLSLCLIFLLISLFVSLTILFLNLLFILLLVFTSSILLALSLHPHFLSFSLFLFAHMFRIFLFAVSSPFLILLFISMSLFFSSIHIYISFPSPFRYLYLYFLSFIFTYTYIFSIHSPLSYFFSLALFTSIHISLLYLYLLSSLFLVSLIRTYRPPLAPPERHRSRLRFISANERFRDELVLEWEQFRRIRTRQRGRGRRTVKSSAKIAPRDCVRHSESPERSQRAEFMRFVSIEGRFLCNDTHTSTIAVTFIPVISSNKRIFHFPSIHNDHLISLYFINFRGKRKRERLCREQKKVIPFSSEGNLIKVDFDGLGEEVENRFNGYSLILHGSVNCFIGCSLFPLWSCLFARPTDTLDFVAFYTVVKLATAAKVAPPCTMLASTLQVKQKLSSSYWIILRTFDYLWGGPKEILVPILRRFKTPDLDLYSSQNQPVKTSFFLHGSWSEEI